MSYYQKHIFICTNQKPEGKKCCAQGEADAMRTYLVESLKAANLYGKNKIRVSSSGCMGRCSQGPAMVIYPKGLWYTYDTKQDIDEIIHKSIISDEVVHRLLLQQ